MIKPIKILQKNHLKKNLFAMYCKLIRKISDLT